MIDRDTHCILSWDVVLERTSEAPQVQLYYSDAFPVYGILYYGAPYEIRTYMQEIDAVEAAMPIYNIT